MAEFASLEGKVALVTGGSRGIGAAISRELARGGARVAVNYRSGSEAAEAIAAEIGGVAMPANVGDPDEARALIERVEGELGDVDVLVNNAGITRDTLIARMSDEDWQEVIDTNLRGTFNTCRGVSRKMLRRRAGAIVNISSVVGVHGNPGQANYAASKAGIIGLTKALARELGSRGVRVNAIAPGYITTELTDVLTEEQTGLILGNTPLGRLGSPEDVATAVRFLCSDEAAFITGDVLLVDGGLGDLSMSTNGRKRVVITGMGAVTPLGNDVETFWANLVAGKSGAGPIQAFDSTEFAVHFACELKGFDPTIWIEHRKARRMDRFTQMILAAARMAEADSGFEIEPETERTGVSVATGIGGLQSFQDCYDQLLDRGPDRVNPLSITAIIPNMGAAWVSMELGTRGPLTSECTACAASNMAIGEAMDAIRLNRADVMFAGGTEAGITKVGIGGFSAMRALSRRNDDPAAASRPFDAERDGFVMGEAGGIVVLEELEHARKRGAKVYAELIGYGLSSDAQHITEPDPTGRHPARAMKMALDDAGIGPEEIDYVNAHGTSTPIGDASETRVIKLALGEEKARRTPVSSTKGATGHCLGASGAIEAIASTLAVQRDVVPPTINQEVADPECDLDYIPNEAREWQTDVALSNNFGFGGHNACLVIRKFTD